jgi:hypothetical protein
VSSKSVRSKRQGGSDELGGMADKEASYYNGSESQSVAGFN